MSFTPEDGVFFKLNEHEFILSPEVEGARYCVLIDKNNRGVDVGLCVGTTRRADVQDIIQDVFADAGQPTPRIDFAKSPKHAVQMQHGFAVQGAAADYRRERLGPYRFPVTQPRRNAGCALDFIAWFCREDTREDIERAAADLRRDVREMRKKRCGRWHVFSVRFWITTTTIVPIAWDGCVRISKKVPILGAWIRAVSAFLGKIDPPRLG